jgi:serine/threonine protein kinase
MNACPDDGWSLTVEVDATYHPPVGAVPTHPATAAAIAIAAPAPAPTETSGDLVAGSVVGEYRVEKKIGEGGMGAVYSAIHPMIGKRAAIKVISVALGTDASAVGRFVQEARSVNQIGHPNIVDVFAFGELPDGRNYFVMEHLQGESLSERIQRAPMPLGEAIEIIDQVADALEAAHEKQIVHRDLKPDNVYLASVRGGRTMVKLLDFGIAKLSVGDGPDTGGGIARTRTGMMMGTPGYLSPEQARGRNVDHRTDIYALGCMMFEVVVGRIPFIADNAMDIVLMHMTAQPPRASELWPEIPPPLDELIARMLLKDANLRPTLAEIRRAFSELVTSGLVTVPSGGGAFRSGLATPGHGMRTPTAGPLAVGTHLSTPAPSTSPPIAAPTTKKKTGLVVGVIAAVALIGGGAAFLAMKGGDGHQAAAKPAGPVAVAVAVATPPATTPTPPPTPEPPKTEPPKTEPPKATVVEPVQPKPAGVIEIDINVDKAQLTVDGKPIEITGRTAKVPVDAEGSHTIAITAPGRDPFEKQVDVKGGETVPVTAKLERAKATSGGTKRPLPGGKKPPPGTKKVEDKNYTVDPFSN